MKLKTNVRNRFAVLCLALPATGAYAVAGLAAGRVSGPSNFYYAPTAGFSRNFASIGAVVRPSFLYEVGGVAFGGVASGVHGEAVSFLSYDRRAPDGKRLVVGLDNGETVRASISDWMLRPIAEFADSGQVAAISTIGNLSEPQTPYQKAEFRRLYADLSARVRAKMHGLPASEQAEISQQVKDLTAEGHGSPAVRRANALLQIIDGEAVIYHPAFQNTLLGIRLYQADNLIVDPVACEVPKIGGVAYRMPSEPRVDVEGNVDRFEAVSEFASGLQPKFQSYVVSDYGQPITFGEKGGRITFKSGSPYWYCWRTDAAGNVRPIPKSSRLISDKVAEYNGVNPAVYNAMRDLMRYSALFRAYKREHPGEYARFVDSLSTINDHRLANGAPIRTPTVILPGGEE